MAICKTDYAKSCQVSQPGKKKKNKTKKPVANLTKKHYSKDTSGKNVKLSTMADGQLSQGKPGECLSFLLAQVHSWGPQEVELGSLEIHHGSLATQDDDSLQYCFY